MIFYLFFCFRREEERFVSFILEKEQKKKQRTCKSWIRYIHTYKYIVYYRKRIQKMNYDDDFESPCVNGNSSNSLFICNSNSNDSSSSTSDLNGETKVKSGSSGSETKDSKQSFPFGLCKVCSDQATGVHYGIATCEGCKVSLFLFELEIKLKSS